MASPAVGKSVKKSSVSKSKRAAPQTTQATRSSNQNISSRTGSIRFYSGNRYSGTHSYVGRQTVVRVTTASTGYYGNNYYGGRTLYYYGGSYPYYSYYSGWPYSNWGYGTSWGYYPYSYCSGAVIPTVVTTTTTRTTRQRMVITHQWLQPCSGALANSATTIA
jgi:hypothetical protein